jgi:hypothetical protein
MRLVLVHGINNQGSSEQGIIDSWLGALEQSLSSADMAVVRRAEIVAPYYGDVLLAETEKNGRAGPQAIAQSVGDLPDEEEEFYREALEDIAPAAGVRESDIRAAAGATGPVEQGLPHDRRLLAIVRALETISPLKGSLVLRILPQAFVYLSRPTAWEAVDSIVRPALGGEKCVVVGHSLGTIVTYKLIREGAATDVPFYLTLGSPLAVKAVQNRIGPAFERAAIVKKWLNALDPDDAVTIGRALKETTFGPGVENIDDVENGDQDAHDIHMYLRDKRVAASIVRALSA